MFLLTFSHIPYLILSNLFSRIIPLTTSLLFGNLSSSISFSYSNVVTEDNKTQHLKKLAHSWRDIKAMSAEQAALLIREDKIDILVEVTGHTAGNRLDVMAMKPAPISVTYIG